MNPTALILVLDKLVDLYARLQKLAEQQHELVAQDQTEELLGLLEQRAEVLAQITTVESKIKPIRQNWQQLSAPFGVEDRTAAEERFARTRSLLEAITQADADDALVLQQRKLNVGRQLQQMNAGVRMNNRYAAGVYADSSKVDVAR
jgi:flagellar biosynthesis/type III secretory pathway chaperone